MTRLVQERGRGLAKINHTEKMKDSREKRGKRRTKSPNKMERAQLAYAEGRAGCKQIEQEGIQLGETRTRAMIALDALETFVACP